MTTNLKDLDRRLSRVENNHTNNRNAQIEEVSPATSPRGITEKVEEKKRQDMEKKRQETEKQVDAIKDEFVIQAKQQGVTSTRAKLVIFAVDFVETFAPTITNLLGYTFKGQFKLDFAMELVGLIFDIADFAGLLGDMIEECVIIKYSKDPKTNETNITIDKELEKKLEKKVKKKACHCL